jgi:hypothetical protein
LRVKVASLHKKRAMLVSANVPENAHQHYTLLSYSFVLKEVEKQIGANKTVYAAHLWMVTRSLALFEQSLGAANNIIYLYSSSSSLTPIKGFSLTQ